MEMIVPKRRSDNLKVRSSSCNSHDAIPYRQEETDMPSSKKLKRCLVIPAAVAATLTGWMYPRLAPAANNIADMGTLSLNGTTNVAGLTAQFYNTVPQNTNLNNTQYTAGAFPFSQALLNGTTPVTLAAPNAGATFAYGAVNDLSNFNDLGATAGQFAGNGNYFQARWSGYFNATVAGSYTFGLNSDDGTVLYVNGTPVVSDNNYQGVGTGPQQTGSITLPQGQNEIVVGYYQGTGGYGAAAYYTPPGGTQGVIPVVDGSSNQILTGSQVVAASSSLTGGDGSGIVSLAAGANGTLSVTGVLNTTFNTLILNGNGPNASSTLNVVGTAPRFGNTTFAGGTVNFVLGGPTAVSANDQSLALGNVSGTGGAVTINKSGPYNLVLDGTTAGALPASSTVNVQGGGLVLVSSNGGPNPLGANVPITLNTAAPAGNSILATLYLGSTSGAVTFTNPVTVGDNANIVAGAPDPNAATASASNVSITLGNATNGVSIASGKTLSLNTVNGNTLIFAGAISGAGNVTVNGGPVNFTISNPAFTGTTTVNAAQLLVGADNSLGASATVNSGAQLSVRANYATATPLTINGTGTNGNGALESSGATYSFAAPITLGSDSFIVASNAGQPLTLSGGVNNNGHTAQFGGSGDITVGTAGITGSGALLKTQGGALNINAASNYQGATTIQAGTLNLNAGLSQTSSLSITGSTVNANVASALPAVGTVFIGAAGLLNSAAADTIPGAVTLNGGTLQGSAGAGKIASYSGGVSLTAGLVHATSGTLDVSAKPLQATPLSLVNGLLEGHLSGSFDTTDPNPGNGNLSTTTFPNNATNVASGPRVGNVSGNSNSSPTGNGFNDNTTYVYTGKVLFPNNNGNGTGSISFGENFDDSVLVKIDGVTYDQDGSYDTPTATSTTTSGTTVHLVTLSAGYHSLEIRFG
jgi:autotransporter-associated beta strand protein